MNRVLCVLPVLAAAFLTIGATPIPSPTPGADLSPTLDKVLVAPPAGFTPYDAPGVKNGHVSLHDYAQSYGVKATEAERLLTQDGFVDAYTMTWIQASAGKGLAEIVIAFKGGRGAQSWLSYDKASGAADPHFQHADTMTGIDPYYGEHLSQTGVGGTVYTDGFVFAKGNDEIGVAAISARDDALSLATAQTKSQYAAAPDSTIPPSQWPENANPSSTSTLPSPGSSLDAGRLIPYLLLLGALALAGGLIAGAFFFMKGRLRAAPRVAGAAAPTPQPLQMSADGNFWFDGQKWIQSSLEPPPFAQRTPDGQYWWDGYNWRPVPLTARTPVH